MANDKRGAPGHTGPGPLSPSRLHLLASTLATAIAFSFYVRVEGLTHLLGWISLVPFLAALDRVQSLRQALLAGLLLTELFTLAVFFWFAGAIQNYTEASLPVAVLVLLVLAPVMQPQFIPFALARAAARRAGAPGWATALAGAGAYVGAEWLLPKLFADTIGHGFLASPRLRQAGDLAGAGGLTFLLVLGNECVYSVLRHRSRRALPAAAGFAGLIAAMLLYGEIRLRQFDVAAPDADTLTAGIVQGDISHYTRLASQVGTYDAVRMILDEYFSLSSQVLAQGSLDLLVWPETVYPTTFGAAKSADGAAFDDEIARFVVGTGVPLVFGSYDREGEDEFNAAMLLEPAAEGKVELDVYRKALLFPLTERVPAWLDSDTVRGWLPWLGTWKPGVGARVLDLHRRDGRAVRLAPLVCYDAVEPALAIDAVRQGAEVIVTLSNDSWFAEGGGPRLHLVVSAFRSIETRRPQVRATNTGISAFISPTGELTGLIGVHEKAVLVRGVRPARGEETLMLAWGDWFGPVALLLGVLSFAAPRR